MRATIIGTSYEIDFSFFLSHIVLLWLISGLALDSHNETFALVELIFALAVPTYDYLFILFICLFIHHDTVMH